MGGLVIATSAHAGTIENSENLFIQFLFDNRDDRVDNDVAAAADVDGDSDDGDEDDGDDDDGDDDGGDDDDDEGDDDDGDDNDGDGDCVHVSPHGTPL